MPTNHPEFDSLLIAKQVRDLLDRHNIAKRQQATEVSRILELSFSQAHRKLKGQSPWTLNQVNQIASAFGEAPSAIVAMISEPLQPAAYEAILVISNREIPCTASIGGVLTYQRPPEFVALYQNHQWRIYPSDEAPSGQCFHVDLIEIRARQAEHEILNIAILDDSVETADELAKYLNNCGFNAVAYYDIDTFCDVLPDMAFDGFILDWLIGQATAATCLEKIRSSENPNAPIMVLTGQLGIDQRGSEIARAMRDYDVLGPYEKPVRLHVIEAALQRCFNLRG